MTDDERWMFNTIAGFLDRDAQGNEGWTDPQDGARKLMALLGQSCAEEAPPERAPLPPWDGRFDPIQALRSFEFYETDEI